ncbi:MAG TPA: amidase [Acidimicrobiales bacterium]|nr:amidase [Acidimicrobiales bacterium]
MDDLHFLPATGLARLLRDGAVSSAELLEHYLARVEEHRGLNAIVALDADRARDRAAAADAARARGETWGPLHGLPMTVKDAFETEGVVTTSGAPELADHVPARDADAVALLKAAGAVVFGKSNLPLYAGDLQTYNAVYGRTDNPWAPDRTVGGSSGGSAAALAAGLTGLELGSDIGGSIRNPAHFCGVFGLKPTWGIVPLRGHIPGPPGAVAPTDVGVAGPLGRSAGDLALALEVLARPSPADAIGWSLALPPPRNEGAVAGLRVATWFDDPFTPVSAETRTLLDAAAAALAGAGARVTPVTPPAGLAELVPLWERLVLPLMEAGVDDDTFDAFCGVEATPVAADEPAPVRALRAITERHRAWLRADEHRHRLRERFARFFDDHDVLLAPVMPTAAFPHDTEGELIGRTLDVDGVTRPYLDGIAWNGAIGVLLLPAAVAPVGRTPGGLPVGVQIVAPHLHDRTAVAVAGHVEDLLGGFVPPPGC